MIRELLTKLLVSNAVAFESSKVSFYLKAAETIKNEQARKFLIRMANEESEHLKRLEKLKQPSDEDVVMKDHIEEIHFLGLKEVEREREISSDASAIEVLQAAIELERDAYDFYYLLSEKAKLRSVKEIFALLATEEHVHLSALEEELAKIAGT